jgi:hypothetical protein
VERVGGPPGGNDKDGSEVSCKESRSKSAPLATGDSNGPGPPGNGGVQPSKGSDRLGKGEVKPGKGSDQLGKGEVKPGKGSGRAFL